MVRVTRDNLRVLGRFSKAEGALTLLFLVTLPLVRVQVREDGRAYYGVARSLIVDHNLQFRGDWAGAIPPTIDVRDSLGRPVAVHVSRTGHIPVHSPIGASLLWMPFIAATHAGVLVADYFGAHIAADGFSRPYLVTLVLATCLYAYAGLMLSFSLARRYVEERWALLAALAMWLGSSLTAYVYVNPSWSHAHSVFAVALFLWYWERTRGGRTAGQWLFLGLISGLMVEVYFPNVVVALVLVVEAVADWSRGGELRVSGFLTALRGYALYVAALLIAMVPTFAIRTILLGSPLASGAYGDKPWNWTSPQFWQVLFSASQGLITTTPIVAPAIVGLFLFARRDKILGRGLIVALVAFCTIIAVYPFWNLGPAFGNRYFISLTPALILGLAFLLSEGARVWGDAGAFLRRAWVLAALLIVWNAGLVFQWSAGMMPDTGRVYWQEVVYNQFRTVPGAAVDALRSRFSFHAARSEETRQAEVSLP
jgi:hypothetical protein